MSDYYILKGKTPVQVPDARTWSKEFEKMDMRRVAADEIGAIRVSTVFLGLDHRFGNDGPPQLFETMIFGGSHDQYQTRCATWDEAEKMHAEALEIAKIDANYITAETL